MYTMQFTLRTPYTKPIDKMSVRIYMIRGSRNTKPSQKSKSTMSCENERNWHGIDVLKAENNPNVPMAPID